MAFTWWWSSIEACLVIKLDGCGMMMKLKFLDYVIVILCLRCNDRRLIINSLCALLWHDDDDVLISHMRVALKGHSHAIPNELNDYDIQGVSIPWPILSYDD